ncbi:MAG: hypothetical protein Q7R84_02610 [bacterium]|nr:hypothetical protein [bacterium]
MISTTLIYILAGVGALYLLIFFGLMRIKFFNKARQKYLAYFRKPIDEVARGSVTGTIKAFLIWRALKIIIYIILVVILIGGFFAWQYFGGTKGKFQTGIIEGSLSYPSDFIPSDMKICAEDTATQEEYCTDTRIRDSKYTYGNGYKIEVPAGSYYVFATTIQYISGYKAYYSSFVTCGLRVDCPSHKPIAVTVNIGEIITGIDPQDWYVPPKEIVKDETTDWKMYKNEEYGFEIALPDSWKGYSIIMESWTGYTLDDEHKQFQGPEIHIRNPKWTKSQPWQDIPVMVFAKEEWGLIKADKLGVSAAPIGPRKLGENQKYGFALPPRWIGFTDALGQDEAEKIVKTFEVITFK